MDLGRKKNWNKKKSWWWTKNRQRPKWPFLEQSIKTSQFPISLSRKLVFFSVVLWTEQGMHMVTLELSWNVCCVCVFFQALMGRWGTRPMRRVPGHTTCCSAPKICWKSTDYQSALPVKFAIILVDPKRDDNVFLFFYIFLCHYYYTDCSWRVIPGMHSVRVLR